MGGSIGSVFSDVVNGVSDVGNAVGGAVSGLVNGVESVGNAIGNFVDNSIPGGWATVGGAALLAVGITDPDLIGLADTGTLTSGDLSAAGLNPDTVAASIQSGVSSGALSTATISASASSTLGIQTALASGASAGDLIAAGATVPNLLAAGATTSDLLAAGVSVPSLIDAGVSLPTLVSAGASTGDLLASGASVSNLLSAGASIGNLVSAGVSTGDLLASGASVSSMVGAGVSSGDLLAAGVSVPQMLSAGATVPSLYEAGVSATTLYNAGASVGAIMDATGGTLGTASELLSAGAPVSSLVSAGASTSELLSAGATVPELVSAGAPITGLVNAGVTTSELVNAGVSASDLLAAGVTPQAIASATAGLSVSQAIAYGALGYLGTPLAENVIGSILGNPNGTASSSGYAGESPWSWGTQTQPYVPNGINVNANQNQGTFNFTPGTGYVTGTETPLAQSLVSQVPAVTNLTQGYAQPSLPEYNNVVNPTETTPTYAGMPQTLPATQTVTSPIQPTTNATTPSASQTSASATPNQISQDGYSMLYNLTTGQQAYYDTASGQWYDDNGNTITPANGQWVRQDVTTAPSTLPTGTIASYNSAGQPQYFINMSNPSSPSYYNLSGTPISAPNSASTGPMSTATMPLYDTNNGVTNPVNQNMWSLSGYVPATTASSTSSATTAAPASTAVASGPIAP